MSDTNQKFSSNIILGGVFITIGIVIGIMSFFKYKQITKSKCDDDTTCFSGDFCDTTLHKCVKYKKRYYLLIPSIIFIIIGVLYIFKEKIFNKHNINSGDNS